MGNGRVHDIEQLTRQTDDYRRVVQTGPHSQLVTMHLRPGEAIGEEHHDDADQLLHVVSGQGEAVLDGETLPMGPGQLVYVPAGVRHDIRNAGGESLRLWTVYTPPEHPDGTVHATKAEADADEHDHH
ncbi:MAG TPA: cupin domain-containing protein [Egicoccus sp.]|nr:cupin domain-containing protein [Egicoccus sp.]HSK21731.1 cupin domain-containing protein [Egicoccus sp.]